MKKLTTLLLTAAALTPCASAVAPNSLPACAIPERVVVLSGDSSMAKPHVMAVLYDTSDFHFHDASAPRFLFLDRKGKVALGIGGYVYGTVGYDFAGVSNTGADFIPFDIPAPSDPARRSELQFTANQSTLFLQLAGHSDRFGTYSAYVQANFTGSGFNLKAAYFKVGNLKAGLDLTTFMDPASLPTVETQGPAGGVFNRTLQVSYTPRVSSRWRLGVAAEMPDCSPTLTDRTAKIAQRVPDIPVYAQYSWSNASHVRASAILRNLSYRDLADGRNRLATGWGVQLSSLASIAGGLSAYGDFTYGHGIGAYIHDLWGNGFDLTPASTPGRLTTPATFAYATGLRYDFTRKFFATALWSQVRVYGSENMAADSFRRSSYFSVNAFYTVFPDCQVSLAYMRGYRLNQDRTSGSANRLMAAVRYSF